VFLRIGFEQCSGEGGRRNRPDGSSIELEVGIPRRAFRIGISVCVAVMGRTLSKDGAFVYRPLGYIEPSPDISPLGMIVTEPPRLK
jgi:hypothetical protein